MSQLTIFWIIFKTLAADDWNGSWTFD